MDTLGIKPNYTELGRRYQMDYRTVKKYHEGYDGKPPTRKSSSVLDKYYDEIKEKLQLPAATVMGTYQFILSKDANIGKYGNFLKYTVKNDLRPLKTSKKAHPRFETPYGKQLQFDWKEDMKMVNKNGEIFEFNIFAATLGASRLHIFTYSKNRTREDVERCLIETFKYIHGVPKEVLTDNMSSIVNHHKKKFVKEFLQFCKDMDVTPKKCRISSPETKGKDESCNRFMSWLIPYNEEFTTENELVEIIKTLNKKINATVNQTTRVTPILLFQKEKDYLKPLPNKQIMDSYLVDSKQITVPSDFLIYYRGSRYSVSPKFINKKVKLKESDNKLYIYYNNELINIHEISNKIINYNRDDYKEGLKEVLKYKQDDEIEQIAHCNLELFEQLNN